MVSRLFQVGSGFNDFETYRHALAGGFDVGYLACCRSKAGSVVLRLGSAFRTFNLFDFRKHLSEDIGKAVGGEKSDF